MRSNIHRKARGKSKTKGGRIMKSSKEETAWKVYRKAMAQGREAYDKAKAEALSDYKKTMTQAWEAYGERTNKGGED